LNYRELSRKLLALNCLLDRQAKGSHEIWRNSLTGSKTTIPNWAGKDLKPGTISRILRDLDLPRHKFDKA